MFRRLLPAFALSLCAAGASADETFRCGNRVVSSDLTVAELRERCGEPDSRETKTEEVRAPVAGGRGTRVVGVKTIETWRYERGWGASPMLVRIVDGKIVSLDRERPGGN